MESNGASQWSTELLAEDAMGYVSVLPPTIRDVREDMILTASPLPDRMLSTVARIRWGDGDVRARVAEVRDFFASAGAEEFCWWLGPSTTPGDLRAQLLALGAVPEETGEFAAAMVLDRDPDGDMPSGVEVRMVETLDDYGRMMEILMEIDESTPPEKRAALLAGLDERWARYQVAGRAGFLATVDGVPAASGQLGILDGRRALLAGGATRPWARSRGCYRALVLARWRLMRERGIEAFVVQASDMSAPILTGMGFRTTATLSVLVDRSRHDVVGI